MKKENMKQIDWYNYETKKVTILYKGIKQKLGLFNSANDALKVIKEISVWNNSTKDYSIHTTAFYYELGCEFFGRCTYSKSIEMDESFDIPSNKEDLTELQKQIDNELNEFMMPTWECLEEQWENENLDE